MPALVVTWHADILRQQLLRPLYGPVQERLLAEAGAIIVATERHVTSSAFLPAVTSKCHVVPYGMDTAPYSHPSAVEAGRQRRASWGNPDRVVLFLGRLVYYKGVPVLLDAMARTDATLVIAGEGRDREALQDQASRLGIADRVRFIGDVPEADLPSVYHACDVFVLPSTAAAEGFGLVQLEAMACGKPVVSTTLPTGVAIAAPAGSDVQIRPRSGLLARGVIAGLGTLDADYRGELFVTMYCLPDPGRYVIEDGERIAQICLLQPRCQAKRWFQGCMNAISTRGRRHGFNCVGRESGNGRLRQGHSALGIAAEPGIADQLQRFAETWGKKDGVAWCHAAALNCANSNS